MMRYALRFAFRLNGLWSRLVRPVTLGVRIILMHEGKVVLVRHTYMDGWHFPGGSLNRWETPLEAAAREAREETGAELLAPPEFLGLFSSYGRGKSDHVAFYLCRHFRLGRALDRWEIAECRHFALDELPPQLNDQSRKVLRDFALRKQ